MYIYIYLENRYILVYVCIEVTTSIGFMNIRLETNDKFSFQRLTYRKTDFIFICFSLRSWNIRDIWNKTTVKTNTS